MADKKEKIVEEVEAAKASVSSVEVPTVFTIKDAQKRTKGEDKDKSEFDAKQLYKAAAIASGCGFSDSFPPLDWTELDGKHKTAVMAILSKA